MAATDAYVEALLTAAEESPPAPEEEEKKEPRRSFILKDVRVFLNSLTRNIAVMKQGGIDADLSRQETDEQLILTISIPKTRAEKA